MTATIWDIAERTLQLIKSSCKFAWQAVAEGGEVVADLGDGLEPARVVDREEFGEVGWFDIEAQGVELNTLKSVDKWG